jgi:hypothetical protein
MSAAAALVVAAALAGCGKTTYFDGRVLPPSGVANRVLIAIQNPSAYTKGTLQFVDAYYDIRGGYRGTPASFSISGFSGALPISIQNMPEEQAGAVYGSGDGSFNTINYATESTSGAVSGLNGLSSSIFVTRNGGYVFAASQSSRVLTVVNRNNGASYPLSLPGVYKVSVNPGGTFAVAFVQNSDYVYYPLQLTAAQTINYSGGPGTWPLGAVDCEPFSAPAWCLFQALDPVASANQKKPIPLQFNRPVKAVFSADGSTAYILSCGPECGGTNGSNPTTQPLTNAAVTLMPIAPMLFLNGQASGTLPSQSQISANCATSGATNSCSIPVAGGASNALVNSSTMYVTGQQPQQVGSTTLYGGNLTVVNLSNNTAGSPISISDGAPGGPSRMILADNNTLWIAMTKCTNGVRAANGEADGCLTMFNTSSNTVTMLEPYLGDATGIAAVTGLNKIYTAVGGQVYIYSTVDGAAIDNQYVTVTGTAYDVAYMDATSDGNNTVY